MIKKILLSVITISAFAFNSHAQEGNTDTIPATVTKLNSDFDLMKRLKISGYIQGQFQVADSSGIYSFAGGNFPSNTDKRFSVRRGRLKATYTGNLMQAVLQVDVTERGVVLKDAYGKITEPWLESFSLTVGAFNRPFGYEISYSSSDRESPERGRMSQIIFNNERDLGAAITFQPPKTSRFNFLRIDAGMFNGTGITVSDFDKYKDFIGRIAISKPLAHEKIKLGVGLSYYNGSMRVDNDTLVLMQDKNFVKYEYGSDTKQSTQAKIYYGADVQLSLDWAPGITTLRGEYVQGEQPAVGNSSSNPQATLVYPTTAIKTPVYRRNFNGAYFYLIQNIGSSKHSLLVKYDWFDPNTEVKGTDVNSANGLTAGDVAFTTIGVGYLLKWDANVKFTFYYDMVTNESTNISGYTKDIKDNVFTARMQVRF